MGYQSDDERVVGTKRIRQFGNFDEEWAGVEISILTGDHPMLIGVSATAHSMYMKLLGRAARFKRDWFQMSMADWKRFLNLSDSRQLRPNFAQLAQSRAIFMGFPAGCPSSDGELPIVFIAGLRLKWPRIEWCEPPYIQIDSIKRFYNYDDAYFGISGDETIGSPGIETEPEVEQVLNVLRSIDAKHYRTLTATEGWVRVLKSAGADLGGMERVHDEAVRFKQWIEGKFETGQLRRESNSHNPRQRFGVNWLRNAKERQREQIGKPTLADRRREMVDRATGG